MKTKGAEFRSAFLQGSIATASDILTKVLSMGLGIIVARGFGAEGKGVYSLVITFIGFSSLIGSAGINFAHVYLLSGQRYSLQLIARNAFLFTVANSAIIIPIAYLVYPLVGLEKSVGFGYFPLIAAMIVCFIFNTHVNAILLAQEHIARLKILSLVIPTLKLIAFMTILLHTSTDKINFSQLVVALALPTIAGTLIYLGQLFRLVKKPIGPGVNTRLMKDSVAYGLKNWAGNLLSQLTYRFDYFLVQSFVSIAQLGYYSVAVSVSELLLFVPRAFSSILLPKFARYEQSFAEAAAAAAIRHILALALFLAINLGVLGRSIIYFLYGARFLPAYIPLLVMLFGTLAMSIVGVIFNFFAGRGRPEIPSYILGGGFILNTGLDFVLIPRWGVIGASLASMVAYISITIVSLWFFWKVTSVKLSKMLLLNREDTVRLRHLFSEGVKWVLRRG